MGTQEGKTFLPFKKKFYFPSFQNNENLEQERLQQVQTLLCQYSELLEASMPPIQTASQELTDTAGQISPEADLEYACTTLGTGPNQPEQLLLDCYVSQSIDTAIK